MKKVRKVTRIIPILVLVALLLSLVPLAGTACGDDDEDAPVAAFSATPTSGAPTLNVTFTDQSTSLEDITAWEWGFGDGETSTEQNPSHVYAGVVDRHDVSLTITSAEGTKTRTKEGYIAVHADQYDSVNLKLSYAIASGQVSNRPADKFEELVELYSGGRVNVTVWGGGTLYTYI